MHNLIHNHKLHNAVCDGFVRMSMDLNEQRLLLQRQSAARIYSLIADNTKNLIYNKYRTVERLTTIRYSSKFAYHTEK